MIICAVFNTITLSLCNMSNPRKRKASGSEWYDKHKKDVLKATAKSLADVLQQESMLNASEKSKLKHELTKEIQWHLKNDKLNTTEMLIFLQTIEYDVATFWDQFKTLTLAGNQTTIDDFYHENKSESKLNSSGKSKSNGSGKSKSKLNSSGKSKSKLNSSGKSKSKEKANRKVHKKVTFADENKCKSKEKANRKVHKTIPDLSLSDCDV